MTPFAAVSRSTLGRALLVFAVLPSLLPAVTRTWSGNSTQNASWSDAAYWGGAVPLATDDAWLNLTDAYATIGANVTAVGNQVVVGRSAAGARLDLTGGTLTTSGELLVGQYVGGSGVVNLSAGTLATNSHLTLGGTGIGQLNVTGGLANVAGTLYLSRYAGGTGALTVRNTNVTAANLSLGTNALVTLDNATVTLSGNRLTTINGYLASGAIEHLWTNWAPVSASYNATLNKTVISAGNGRQAGLATFGSDTLGQRAVTFTYGGVRALSPAPEPGVHPRIYFNSDELPAIRARLTGTAVGAEAMKMVRYYTRLLREGRSYFDALPASERLMPDGTARISNLSLYGDRSVTYAQLVAGNSTGLASQTSSTLCTLGGLMALEAFECLIDAGQPGITTRQSNLAAALDTWAQWAVTQPDLSTTAPWKFADHQTALAYDLVYNQLTGSQPANIRKAIARVVTYYMARNSGVYYGATYAAEAAVSNWCALDSFEVLAACAIEQEVTLATDGVDPVALANWFKGAMKGFHKFHTYGWWPNGAPYEGQGKNYLFAAHQIAAARRGYDQFGHPHVRAYGNQWLPAITQPFGHAFAAFDVLGGTGDDPERGGWLVQANDFIGLKFMYPSDAGVDFAWRNYVYTRGKLAGGGFVTFLDLRDAKFSPRDSRYNNLLAAAVFASDVASSASWADQNAAVLGATDYLDLHGGNLIARSGFEADAASFLVHVRQDFGGHTHADRGAFTFAALGRLFFTYNSAGGRQDADMQGPEFNGTVLVDGLASKVTYREGDKMRIPAKVAAWSVPAPGSGAPAAFLTGDATYTYSNEWEWYPFTTGGTMLFRAGFTTAETATFNHFRRSNNQLPEAYANTPFWNFPCWLGANLREGMQKRAYNPMQKVYRTGGLVRATKPYALILDDIRKDDATHTYKWLAPIANDLEIVTGAALPAGLNPATDIVLQEPAATGNRRVLVRILRADGTAQQAAGSTGSTLAYRDVINDALGRPHARLVIERAAVVEPIFRVLIMPFRAGDALPTSTINLSPTNDYATVNFGSTQDVISFRARSASVAGQTVTIREFILSRDGVQQLDYRNQIEPLTIR